MKNEDFKKVIEGIEGKIGKENSALISDDLGTLISDNITMNKSISERDEKIKKQEETNQKLVLANSSLLQQVGTTEVKETKKKRKNEDDEDEEMKISWADCFDKRGNFLK